MKKWIGITIIALLILNLWSMQSVAGARDDLYQQFGMKLIEAISRVQFDEINALRAEHALPTLNNATIIYNVQTELDALADYTWQD